MMFGKPQHFNAKLIAKFGLGDAFRDHALITGGIAAFGKKEIAEAQHSGLRSLDRRRLNHARQCASFFLACNHLPAL
jgi:hypothetical protein